MRLLSGALLLVVVAAACTAPPPAPPPPPTSAPPTAPTQAPASTASRVEVLNSANAAFLRGDMASAAQLYERVTNTPPNEAPDVATAITDFAYFRAAMALLASGDEDQAKAELDALQSRDANAPLAQLGAQLWDQYGMTAQLRAACAQLRPQIATQAAQTFTTLTAAGVNIDPASVCSVPPTS